MKQMQCYVEQNKDSQMSINELMKQITGKKQTVDTVV